MALRLDQEKLCCSVCLDLPKDPATLPCGHSCCMSCVESHWDEEAVYSCPRCKQTFSPRPVLVISSMFAALLEALKKTVPADRFSAAPGDLTCDFCTGRKLKALKSCLVCRVSYCELHLQPHYESPAFKTHTLVKPSENLQEKFCSRHDEVMKIFCRTDQQTICVLCSMDDHKDHDTVSAVEERKERRSELAMSVQKIKQRIDDLETDVTVLQQEVAAINHSADEVVQNSEVIFKDLVSVIEERSSAVKEEIRSQAKTEVSRVKGLQEKLEEELVQLRGKAAELQQLSHSDDHILVLHKYPLLSDLCDSDSPRLKIQPLKHFEDVVAAVTEACDTLKDVLNEEGLKISLRVSEVDVLLPQPEPKSRDEFLKYSRQITLDPNTVNAGLSLSEGNRKATVVREKRLYPSHRDRFTDCLQVLSGEGLTGRCYWEVQRGSGGISVAVAYKDLIRTGSESGFGNNGESWALGCFDMSYNFRHNNVRTVLSGPRSSRIGVYLDHRAGSLSFYSVSDTMTLLHRVQTTFTQPLHAGLWVYWVGDTAELCELK
ncbi:E3 ubiquitin/ISG15 ligase TRIM25-like [Eleginops maclovinus]|uniref:E3 ubiquitin/ISG15 ligase TRIM25-like n=1 Tax=Eleginops maclovinus TaxID=56733 RepID=UPI003080BD9D